MILLDTDVAPTPDGYIAAIATAHDVVVASRDTGAFKATRPAWSSRGPRKV